MLFALVLAAATPQTAQVPPSTSTLTPLSLERIQQEPPLEGRRPSSAAISPGGHWVTFLKASVDDSEVLDLWARPLPSGEPRLLVATKQLLGGKDQKLTEQERMALERKRISKRGITEYQWCGTDDKTLLFPLSGDLYIARLTEKGPEAARLTTDDDEPELNPLCSDDGQQVAWVKKGNVVVRDLKSNKDKVVTKGSSDTVTFGLPEFIAEEELDRHEGMWWSKDGKTLLVLKVDESNVGVKVRAQIFADKTEMVSQRYPAAGEKNAVVTPLLIDVKTGKTTTLPLPKDAEYVARAGFIEGPMVAPPSDGGEAFVEVLSRDQTQLTLLGNDRGRWRSITTEREDAWVETHDDLRGLNNAVLWSSESSGRRQLELIDSPRQSRKQLTSQSETVKGVVCAHEVTGSDGVVHGHVVFAGAAHRGRAQHLYAFDFDGGPGGAEVPGPVRALTSGDNWNDASADDGCTTLLVTTSSWGVPPTTTIVDVKSGKTTGTVDGDPPDPLLSSMSRGKPQWLDLTAADGKTILNGLYLPPVTTTNKASVPVITYAYGGPTGQVVAHKWQKLFPLFTHWNQQGFGVFLVDTRGMSSRDRSFTRAHKNAFGKVEVDDIFAAARQLPTLIKAVDPQRIGIFGWSYGGTLAARSMLDDNTPFAAGAAVAPVTDWTLYDTAYTERYIGLPDSGRAATYASSSLLPRAKLLKKPLLLAHGTADDNVLFEHTLRLVQALEDEGALFQTSIYPGKAHGIAGKKAQLHLHKTLTRFFVDTLRP